ncbi:hypothetical protein AMTR_s00040p00232050 [Amborella trichopoda]|uniref:Uncharacterized protein n=1 Tax=Amborella trichopoda TaxID=13333 RepID=W1PZ03_AMBTC|nr:hypothetical protein AMTR_s00040p00232050 [Amborella trichopoda]
MAEQKQQEELERGKMVATPSFVTFPKSSNNTDTTASVKLQAEDSATSPKNMWQRLSRAASPAFMSMVACLGKWWLMVLNVEHPAMLHGHGYTGHYIPHFLKNKIQ